VKQEPDYVPRSIRLADCLVVVAGFFHNIFGAIHILAEELLDLATYNAIRKTQVSKAWEDFTQDLEKMEDGNG
jgi:hypothetical protein